MAESSPSPDQPNAQPSGETPALRLVGNESHSKPSVVTGADRDKQPSGVFRVVPRPRISHLGLTCGDQLLLGTFVAASGLLLAAHWALMSGWGAKPVEVDRLDAQPLDYQIDVNTATHLEWMQLDSIGEILAERIIEDRDVNGPFHSIDDLQRVKGIGPKTVEKIRPYVRVEHRD